MSVRTLGVTTEVVAERVRQDQKYGAVSRPDGTTSDFQIFVDAIKTICDRGNADGSITWRQILIEEVLEALVETEPLKLRLELIQAAAVCVAWVEDIDQRRSPCSSS